MDSTPNHPRVAITGSIFDELPTVARTDEERSRIIREVVSLAMEDPLDPALLDPALLTPMPIPTEQPASQPQISRSDLTPLPTADAPFQPLD